MSYEKQLSRWLHKRLYHNYVNASLLNTYQFLLSSVKRDSGLIEQSENQSGHKISRRNP